MYAILCTDGELNLQAVFKECRKEKWIPIFAYREEQSPDVPIIPLFHRDKDSKNFAKRNLPEKWLKGAVHVTSDNIKWMEDKGWKMEPMNFPRKINELPGISLGFEIMEFFEQPEIYFK